MRLRKVRTRLLLLGVIWGSCLLMSVLGTPLPVWLISSLAFLVGTAALVFLVSK